MFFRTSKGETVRQTITAHKDQCKGDLITAELENPIASRMEEGPMMFR
jgi:hypothetical protein